MNIEFTEVLNTNVRYSVVNNGDRQIPLLICNGIGQSLETLASFAEQLQDRVVILYDAPSAGRSETPLIPMTIKKHSRIAVGLLDTLGYKKVDVMGVSWGGSVAQQLAHSYPDYCHKLVLAITCAGGLSQIPGPLGVMLEMAIPTRYLSRRRKWQMLPKIYGGDALNDPSMIQKQYAENKSPTLYGYYSQFWAMRCWTSMYWLHRITQPTLVISGKKDPLVPPINQKILAFLIPNARLKTYDCGHLLLRSRRNKVLEEIEGFLAN